MYTHPYIYTIHTRNHVYTQAYTILSHFYTHNIHAYYTQINTNTHMYSLTHYTVCIYNMPKYPHAHKVTNKYITHK